MYNFFTKLALLTEDSQVRKNFKLGETLCARYGYTFANEGSLYSGPTFNWNNSPAGCVPDLKMIFVKCQEKNFFAILLHELGHAHYHNPNLMWQLCYSEPVRRPYHWTTIWELENKLNVIATLPSELTFQAVLINELLASHWATRVLRSQGLLTQDYLQELIKAFSSYLSDSPYGKETDNQLIQEATNVFTGVTPIHQYVSPSYWRTPK